MSGHHHARAALPPGKRPDTHFTGGWVVLGVRYVWVRKISPPSVFECPDRPSRLRYPDRRFRFMVTLNASSALRYTEAGSIWGIKGPYCAPRPAGIVLEEYNLQSSKLHEELITTLVHGNECNWMKFKQSLSVLDKENERIQGEAIMERKFSIPSWCDTRFPWEPGGPSHTTGTHCLLPLHLPAMSWTHRGIYHSLPNKTTARNWSVQRGFHFKKVQARHTST
jgi:hypothetical protein